MSDKSYATPITNVENDIEHAVPSLETSDTVNALILQAPLESVSIMNETSILPTATVELLHSSTVTHCDYLFD